MQLLPQSLPFLHTGAFMPVAAAAMGVIAEVLAGMGAGAGAGAAAIAAVLQAALLALPFLVQSYFGAALVLAGAVVAAAGTVFSAFLGAARAGAAIRARAEIARIRLRMFYLLGPAPPLARSLKLGAARLARSSRPPHIEERRAQEAVRRRGHAFPLEARLAAGREKFFDPKLGAVQRFLPNVGADKNRFAVDSWYLYHWDGHAPAEKLFFGSLDYAIKAAKHFRYA